MSGGARAPPRRRLKLESVRFQSLSSLFVTVLPQGYSVPSGARKLIVTDIGASSLAMLTVAVLARSKQPTVA